MKVLKISTLIIMTLSLSACARLNKEQLPLSITALPVSVTPEPSKTAQPTKTVIPTQTTSPTPDPCSKETVPADTMGVPQPGLYANKLVAYGVENEQGSYDIYVANWDHQNERRLTDHPADDGNPRWSPDGKQIAFLSNRNSLLKVPCNGAGDECKYQLFVINADGTGLKRVTKTWTFSPVWSPDGKRIAFLGAFKSELSPNPDDPFLYDIFVVNADGSNLQNLTDSPGYYSDPAWSPDGQKIAFASGEMAVYPNSLNIINADGTGLSAYSDKKAYEFVWAPDGTSLLFVYGSYIYKLKVDSLRLEQLSSLPQMNKDVLTLSPDGKWLAYHLYSKTHMCDQIRVLNTDTLKDYFVYDAKDIEKIPLDESGTTPTYSSFSISSIIWRPDGKQLIFRQGYQVPMIFGEFDGTFAVQLDGSQLEHMKKIEAIQP